MQTQCRGQALYLQTSPEFAMKRLLAAGSGSIYQLCKVFRNNEVGRHHHPEFSLLEWYQLDYSLMDLMQEVATLIKFLLNQKIPRTFYQYADLFSKMLAIDITQVNTKDLQQSAIQYKLAGADSLELDKNGWLDYLLSLYIIPKLPPQQLSFIYYYPAEQASLSRLCPENPLFSERFELVYQGLELANGFHELADAQEQLARFKVDNQKRLAHNLPEMPIDQNLIQALKQGLPDCCGVALGVDRLLMIQQQATHLQDILSFSCLE